jgi:hypothetical protein
MFEDLCGQTGTLVIWENCDRLLSKDFSLGSKEQAAIKRMSESLDKHLSMVFHRFLAPEDLREKNNQIRINGNLVKSWNPLYPRRSEQVLAPNKQNLEIELSDGKKEFAQMKAWILPNRSDMTKHEENEFAPIPSKAQGFYGYRERRLIQLVPIIRRKFSPSNVVFSDS